MKVRVRYAFKFIYIFMAYYLKLLPVKYMYCNNTIVKFYRENSKCKLILYLDTKHGNTCIIK